ncbi:MAG: glycosyltransferase [Chitinophagaceae bacterium]
MLVNLPFVSIIIPTHNRCKSLIRLLHRLAIQTYPMELMEVIVVLDNCTDATNEVLLTHKAPFSFRHIQGKGRGAAMSRNEGASLATGVVFLFIDDDIEPGEGMVAAHIKCHTSDQTVVIGYLPFPIQKKASFVSIYMREWWEEKFRLMGEPGYRFGYEDLLSGNFSISSHLFIRMNGFNELFKCREDYELGARLIKAGANFAYSKDAFGYHRDEVSSLQHSLERKKNEGVADLLFSKFHPDLMPRLRIQSLRKPNSLLGKFVHLAAFNMPLICNVIEKLLRKWMEVLDKYKFRVLWQKYSWRIHLYSYLLGVAAVVKSPDNLYRLIERPTSTAVLNATEMVIDLEKGIDCAEQKMDNLRPLSLEIRYGKHLIGIIPSSPGTERLRGRHLRPILAEKFYLTLFQILTVEHYFDSLWLSENDKFIGSAK